MANRETAKRSGVFALLLVMLFVTQAKWCGRVLAQGVPTPSYWSMQFTNFPPLPFNPFPNAATFLLDSNNIAYDDREVDYTQLREQAAQRQMSSAMFLSESEPPPVPGGTNDLGFDPGVPSPEGAYDYGTNVLWIEIYAVTNDLAYLTLHNTKSNKWYQWLSKPTLDPGYWKPGQVIFNDSGTNQIYFDPVPTERLATTFYRGAEGNWKLSAEGFSHAIEPSQGQPATPGYFRIILDAPITNDLDAVFLLSGSATHGVDYDLSTSSPATIGANDPYAQIEVQPYEDSLLEFEEQAVLRLVVTNGYVVDPRYYKAVVWIADNFGTNEIFEVVANHLNTPVGIDYYAPSNALLFSFNSDPVIPASTNFALLRTNGEIIRWSGISNVLDEVKVAIVRTNLGGFTNGDCFFGSETGIGWLRADGGSNVLDWCILTNAVVTNALLLRGSLGFDQTGIWSNQLIAVTSDSSGSLGAKGVWRVDSDRHPTLITTLTSWHLEGVIALSSETNQWGPWAGKIVTGDEDALDPNSVPRPVIYAVDTNGFVRPYLLSIFPEDFDIITTNQDLYCVLLNRDDSSILRLSRSLLTNYVGSLLITQAGESPAPAPRLFITQWDSTQEDFVTRAITLPGSFSGTFEHVTFAPIVISPSQ